MRAWSIAAACWLSAASSAAQSACPGDCDGDHITTPAEFAAAVHAAFDAAVCTAADLDDNGVVTAAELLRIRSALVSPPQGCLARATSTPSLAPTPTATPATPATPLSEWITLTPLPGGPRQEIGAAALDGRVYVLGGLTDTGTGSAKVEVYDTGANQWQNAADLPAPRHHVGAIALGGSVYSVGGFSGSSFSPASDVYRYDPAQNEWSAGAALPAARGALAVAELYGQLFAVGGSTASGSVTDHTVYDPETDEWSFVTNLPTPRNHLAAVALNGYMYVIGGRADGGGNANTGELDRYDPIEDRWDVLTPMPTARSGHAAAVLDGRIVVMGGEVNPDNPPNDVFVEVEVYDPSSDRWTTLDPMALPRHGIGAVTIAGLIYVPGGATRAGFGATDHADALRITW
jgi:N-acetylneuraminic acid mutarotase